MPERRQRLLILSVCDKIESSGGFYCGRVAGNGAGGGHVPGNEFDLCRCPHVGVKLLLWNY